MSADVLVIGYGNTLRGDDGIGPAVAADVAALGLSGVRVIVTHQLTPELAANLADARLAVFIDAATGGESVTGVQIEAAEAGAVLTHVGDPREPLALCVAVYRRCPEAWLVTAAGADFDLHDGLSPTGRENAQAALGFVKSLIERGAV
jgi:hydrogenase maturation protease